MKVIGINGSVRKNGNTALLIQTVFEELHREHIETELIQLAGTEIHSCRACYACKKLGRCVMNDDPVNAIFEKMCMADGMILGSPIYSADISGKMKTFLERIGVIVALNPGLFAHKAGAAVAAVRRSGGLTGVDTMNHFMMNKEMLIVGSTYWNMGYGLEPGDVLNDKEGLHNMRNIGKNMAWLLKKLK